MILEIVSPEATIFQHPVDSVVVPGVNGAFEMLNNHAPIVSILKEGSVKINMQSQNAIAKEDLHKSLESLSADNKTLLLKINSGTLEMKDNKIIILAD